MRLECNEKKHDMINQFSNTSLLTCNRYRARCFLNKQEFSFVMVHINEKKVRRLNRPMVKIINIFYYVTFCIKLIYAKISISVLYFDKAKFF